MDSFTFLREICGYTDIVCTHSMYSDLSNFYGIRIHDHDVNHMVNLYNAYHNSLWEYIKQNKITDTSETDDTITFPETGNGFYPHVLKVDFQRAFTNYIELVIDTEFITIFERFCMSVARLRIPSSAKKFLYNYTLTNLLISLRGKANLYKLRRTVYDDVLHVSNSLGGEIIKAEIDGAYVQTIMNEPYVNDVYGNVTCKQFNYVLIAKNKLMGLTTTNDVTLKGISKNQPNIFKKMIQKIISTPINERDKVLDDFLFSDKHHILDWCFKTDNGDKVKIKLNKLDIELTAMTAHDVADMQELMKSVNREAYLLEIYDVISILMENIE